MLASGHDLATEAYRILRTNLQFAGVDRPLRTLMITSPAPGEGKSLTVSNLGAAWPRPAGAVHRGRRRPPPPQPAPGLRPAQQRRTHHRPAGSPPYGRRSAARDSGARAHVLTSGPLPPNPAELLGSARMRELTPAPARGRRYRHLRHTPGDGALRCCHHGQPGGRRADGDGRRRETRRKSHDGPERAGTSQRPRGRCAAQSYADPRRWLLLLLLSIRPLRH